MEITLDGEIILDGMKAFDNVQNREMKSESGVSLAMASQPFEKIFEANLLVLSPWWFAKKNCFLHKQIRGFVVENKYFKHTFLVFWFISNNNFPQQI